MAAPFEAYTGNSGQLIGLHRGRAGRLDVELKFSNQDLAAVDAADEIVREAYRQMPGWVGSFLLKIAGIVAAESFTESAALN